MNRRGFLAGGAAAALASEAAPQGDIVIEKSVSGQPHRGKVLALITPHLDDGPIFAGGTLAKLLREGYDGYFIRTSNDEKDSNILAGRKATCLRIAPLRVADPRLNGGKHV